MKQITLMVDEQLEKLLVQFLHTDNRGTHNPIYLVETQQNNIVFDGGDSGGPKYYCHDDNEVYDTPEELVAANTSLDKDSIRPFEDLQYEDFNDVFIYDEADYFKAYEVQASAVSEVMSYRPVAYFFSEEEALSYKKYQSHNLTNPRTYADAPGYANKGDWDPFYELLREIGKKCEAGAEQDGGDRICPQAHQESTLL